MAKREAFLIEETIDGLPVMATIKELCSSSVLVSCSGRLYKIQKGKAPKRLEGIHRKMAEKIFKELSS